MRQRGSIEDTNHANDLEMNDLEMRIYVNLHRGWYQKTVLWDLCQAEGYNSVDIEKAINCLVEMELAKTDVSRSRIWLNIRPKQYST
jgi:hypothetical protein